MSHNIMHTMSYVPCARFSKTALTYTFKDVFTISIKNSFKNYILNITVSDTFPIIKRNVLCINILVIRTFTFLLHFILTNRNI